MRRSVRYSHRVWPPDLRCFLASLRVRGALLTTLKTSAAGKSDQAKLLVGLAPSPVPDCLDSAAVGHLKPFG